MQKKIYEYVIKVTFFTDGHHNSNARSPEYANYICKITSMYIDKVMKVKVAIPTDDGRMIDCASKYCRGFYVATLSDGKVIREEVRWNLLSEILVSGLGFYYNLADCDCILLKKHQSDLGCRLKTKGIKVCYTNESLVSQAIQVCTRVHSVAA